MTEHEHRRRRADTGRSGEPESGIDVVLVTGLSGAGRGTAAKVLEDLGWYVADNLPPELIARMVDLGLAAGSRITQLAVVMDVRSRGFTGDLDWVRNDLATRNIHPRVLFMEASDDILVRRYEQNRRSHPLQGNQTLAEGIAAERAMLAPVRASADLVIDTSTLSVPALRESIERAFGGETVAHTSVTVESFGFKYGLPMDADMVMDVRFLPNPHWVDELRPHTGQHPAVRDYVLGQPGAEEFLETYHRLLKLVIDGYRREGKRYMTVAIGCTGGKHRSVAMAEALAGLLDGHEHCRCGCCTGIWVANELATIAASSPSAAGTACTRRCRRRVGSPRTSPRWSPSPTTADRRAGCAANSMWCRRVICEWRWPRWHLTVRTAGCGRPSSSTGSAAAVRWPVTRSAT